MPKLPSLNIFIDGLNVGGAESLLVQLLPKLTSQFESVEIHCFNGNYALESKFEVFKIKKHSYWGMVLEILRSQSIGYFHLARSSLLALMLSFLVSRKAFIIHLHTTLHFHRLKEKAFRKRIADNIYLFFLRRALLRKQCKIVVSSNVHLQEVEIFVGRQLEVGTDAHIFPNTFSNERIETLRNCRKPSPPSQTIRLLTLSRLDPIKQVDWAMDAAHAIARTSSNRRIELNIFGNGPSKAFLENRIQELEPLSNLTISLCGFAENVMDPLATSDIYLLPSRLEGCSLSLTEAALSGILCIATDCPNGPRFLASCFSNIVLATPPTRERFVEVAVEAVHRLSHASLPATAKKWQSLEDLAPHLAAFLANSSNGV